MGPRRSKDALATAASTLLSHPDNRRCAWLRPFCYKLTILLIQRSCRLALVLLVLALLPGGRQVVAATSAMDKAPMHDHGMRSVEPIATVRITTQRHDMEPQLRHTHFAPPLTRMSRMATRALP